MEQNKEKSFGHLEEAPMVAVVEEYGIITSLTEDDMKPENEEQRRKKIGEALAGQLMKDGYVTVGYADTPKTNPDTGEKHFVATASIYVKTKDSDILHTGKTRFVRPSRKHPKKKYIIRINEIYLERLYLARGAESTEKKQQVFTEVIGSIRQWLTDNENRPLVAYRFRDGQTGQTVQSWTVENFTDGTDFPLEVRHEFGWAVVGIEA